MRTAVVGVGYHGRHHARILASMDNCRLAAVADPHESNCRASAEAYGCEACCDYRDLLGRVDAVVVATPTVTHFPIASEFLRRGIPTLVEKPLAFSPGEAAELVRLAAKHGAMLQVGHIERFNPAFQKIEAVVDQPRFIEAKRHSRFPFRSLDVSVVFDVMIHDIDLALALVDAEVDEVDAIGACVVSPTLDRVEARLRFVNGAVAQLSADRTHRESVRQLRVWNRDLAVDADLQRRTVHTTPIAGRAESNYPADLSLDDKKRLWDELFPTESFTDVSGSEPLRLEIADFLSNVRSATAPKVDGVAGQRAVGIAARIEALAQGGANLTIHRAA